MSTKIKHAHRQLLLTSSRFLREINLRRSFSISGIAIIALFLITFTIRVVLASRLDMMTDEGIYISGGKIYFPLLQRLEIAANGSWAYNYEHPPLVKILIGLSLRINSLFNNPLPELLAGRMPTIMLGTMMVVAVYVLGRTPFGHLVAFAAALSLAFSPWLSFFSSLAYLDVTMISLMTIAYLLLWHAIRQPQLYLAVGALVGGALASKYPAALMIPPMLIFTAYFFFILRRRLPDELRPPLPWRWWIAACVLVAVAFFICNPVIWPDPFPLLMRSISFQWQHSVTGHLFFLAGEPMTHTPIWTIFYILAAKISIFITIPALCFCLLILIRLIYFHLWPTRCSVTAIASESFLWIWLLGSILTYGNMTIVVGSHYHLPVAPAVVLAGTWGLAMLLRFQEKNHAPLGWHILLWEKTMAAAKKGGTETVDLSQPGNVTLTRPQSRLRQVLTAIILLLAVCGPHLHGLTTIPQAEGYTSVLFQGENNTIQVAYSGYRDALTWLAEHTNQPADVGLVATAATLNMEYPGPSWWFYNQHFEQQFTLSEVSPTTTVFPYDYLIWPMHLEQRGYPRPIIWDVLHTVSGGETTYSYILVSPFIEDQAD